MPYRSKASFPWKPIVFVLVVSLLLLTTAAFALRPREPEAEPVADSMEMEMHGQRYMTTEYGQPYVEPGIYALLNGTDPVEVLTEGQVNTDSLGTYRLKYLAQKNGVTRTAYREVTVVDSIAPQIALNTQEGYFTKPGQPYVEEGFTASDNHDGDLTHLVQSEEKDGIVTYRVSDSSGNVTTVTREIVYGDMVAPVITLNGENFIVLYQDESFQDPGAYAVDDCDGDISAQVTVTGSVDITTPGAYVLEYAVKDTYGNGASVSRTVCILPKSDEPLAASNGKVIYLTFDDGPSSQTDRLLDILAKYKVKATFFVVNTGYINRVERAANEGHTVAIHTATHRFDKIYTSEEAYYNDLYTMQGIIESYTGKRTMLLRFPGGSSNTISMLYNRGIMTRLVEDVVEKGFYYFDWNVDSKDAGGAKTADEVFNNVITGISKHDKSVVLQHDLYDYSVDAVEKIIIWGLTNGYTFAPITENSPGCYHNVNN